MRGLGVVIGPGSRAARTRNVGIENELECIAGLDV